MSVAIKIILHFQMELLTAVLSGARTLELRVFTEADLPVADEKRLNKRLCRLVDRFDQSWLR